jgi:hypothetical protein
MRGCVLGLSATESDLGQLESGGVVPVHAVKAYRGSIGVAPLILNLGTR